MIGLKEKKILAVGKLNADDHAYVIPPNDFINAFNVRSQTTDTGFTNIDQAVGSTVRLSVPSPSVSFLEIGAIEDIPNNRFVTFYYNTTTSQHKIMCWDETLQTELLVLVSSQVTGGLNFSKNYPIHSARIINGILYWTDNYNPPRKLNIDAAIKMNNPSYSTTEVAYTNPLEQSVISLIRKPPSYPLSAAKSTAGGITVNNIVDFAGFFAWRYTFRDDEISVLSPVSKLVNYNTITDTYNAVELVAVDPTGTVEQIPQDVQTVDFCVRYGKDPNFFIVKSWDKRITAQATEIANHNAGIDPLSYFFYNDITGIALDSAYSVKPYDSVPLLSRGLEAALNRLFLAYNLVAYNTPTLTSLAINLVPETNHTPYQNPSFHSASNRQVGIIFRDQYKRIIGNVFTNDTYRFTVPDRNYSDATYYYYLNWTLSNAAATSEIPLDAAFYEIVITKDLRTRFFVQAKSGGMKYAIKDPVTNIISYQDTYISSAYGLAFDASLLNAAGMGYAFDPSTTDILKVYQELSATIYSLAVINQDGNYIISTLQDLGSFATQPNIIFEIYTPYKELISEPFFTTGETYKITLPGTGSRTYSAINGQIYGDVWRFGRFAPSGSYNAENMSPAVKYWKVWNTNSGEANFVFNSEQVRKQTAIQWSNVIIEGSQINGLSTFDALDERILPFSLGPIQKIQQTSKTQEQGNIMLAIGEQDTASLYLGEVQVVGADANAFLAQAPNVIGTVNILKGNFGTISPESVVEYRGSVFWLDMGNGRVIQYASNGLFAISNYKMTTFWKQFCEQFMSMTAAEIEALGGRPFVFGVVDPKHDELMFSIPKLLPIPPAGYLPDYPAIDADARFNLFNIYDGAGKTVVFCLGTGDLEPHWRGSDSYNPEGFVAMNNQLYSFKAGQLWQHNQSTSFCNFYGVQYKAQIMCVSNVEPQVPKIYNNVSFISNMSPTFVYFYNTYPYQQSSDLVNERGVNSFADLEGTWYATILRNKLVPTAAGYTTDGLLTAEKMRNTNMLIQIEFTVTTTPLQLRFFEVGYQLSSGHTT